MPIEQFVAALWWQLTYLATFASILSFDVLSPIGPGLTDQASGVRKLHHHLSFSATTSSTQRSRAAIDHHGTSISSRGLVDLMLTSMQSYLRGDLQFTGTGGIQPITVRPDYKAYKSPHGPK